MHNNRKNNKKKKICSGCSCVSASLLPHLSLECRLGMGASLNGRVLIDRCLDLGLKDRITESKRRGFKILGRTRDGCYSWFSPLVFSGRKGN